MHRFNVKYTEIRSTGFAEIALMFQNAGYKLELRTEPDYAPDGLRLEDIIYAYFTHPYNSNEEIITNVNERHVITEVLNYLICLSRFISPTMVKKHLKFNFDGCILDLFIKIKNDFQNGKLNLESILNDHLYKQIVSELDKLEVSKKR